LSEEESLVELLRNASVKTSTEAELRESEIDLDDVEAEEA